MISQPMRHETVIVRGAPVRRDCIDIGESTLAVTGRVLRVGRLLDEWRQDLTDAEKAIEEIRRLRCPLDLVTFWQRLPDKEPHFPFYYELEDIAAIPISSYEHWWTKQINNKTRNMVRKSERKGVVISEARLTPEFIAGVVEIFNESPVRRGKPFWHYGKGFDAAKEDLTRDSDSAVLIAAHCEGQLIGFIKLLDAGKFGMITLILDRIAHRDKAPANGMIAKAVELCAARGLSHLTYTVWRRGDHGEFQKRNGFQRIPVPRYFVPVSLRGKLALRLGLHRGLRHALPDPVQSSLLNVRRMWYERRASWGAHA